MVRRVKSPEGIQIPYADSYWEESWLDTVSKSLPQKRKEKKPIAAIPKKRGRKPRPIVPMEETQPSRLDSGLDLI